MIVVIGCRRHDDQRRWVCVDSAVTYATVTTAETGVSLFERFWSDRRRRVRGVAAGALLAAIGLLTFVPRWQIAFDPFRTADDAQQYLQTLWQVVAAVVGVSVALIAFVFEAFVRSGERRHGGTLREFARQTHILVLFDLAAISLVLDGLALAGVGDRAPGGPPCQSSIEGVVVGVQAQVWVGRDAGRPAPCRVGHRLRQRRHHRKLVGEDRPAARVYQTLSAVRRVMDSLRGAYLAALLTSRAGGT